MIVRALIPLVLLLAATPLAMAQCEVQLLAPDGATWDDFSYGVALEGDTAVVGAPGDTAGGIWSGSVYVFVRSAGNWALAAKLLPADQRSQQRFGESVALSGDTLVVGAPGDDEHGKGAGATYVFVGSGSSWSQEAKLSASNATAYQEYGSAVAVEGDRAVVGAPTWASMIDGAGWAFVYDRVGATWSEVAVLEPGDPEDNDLFGYSVAVQGGRVAVGAPFADVENGATYVFTEAGGVWAQTEKIKPADLQYASWFGTSLAFEGAWLVVGAMGRSEAGYGAGAAYLYEDAGGAWQERAKLLAGDSDFDDRFGWTVAMSQGRVLVGAPWEDGDCGYDCKRGKTYLFEDLGGGWGQVDAFVSSDQGDLDFFGAALAADGDTALCGAFNHDGPANNMGAAYVYRFEPVGSTYCVANANSSGLRAAISATGSTLVTDNCLLLIGAKLPTDQFAYFLMSQSQDFVPYFAGSQGNLCLGGPIVRFANETRNSGSGGIASMRLDLNDLPQGTVFQSGETWYFQLWFRDDNPHTTSNTTDGLAVTWQ
jgi:FG-GAP repeat